MEGAADLDVVAQHSSGAERVLDNLAIKTIDRLAMSANSPPGHRLVAGTSQATSSTSRRRRLGVRLAPSGPIQPSPPEDATPHSVVIRRLLPWTREAAAEPAADAAGPLCDG
ncbi:MAG: hypothetical protein NVSMB25_17930 [Thermoleophilaceae bacterium]